MLNEKILQLKADLQSLDEKFKEIKAMPVATDISETDKKMYDLYDYMDRRISNIVQMIYALEDDFSMHKSPAKGHLPPIMGADKMNKALKALGLDGDFECQKRIIYASSPKKSSILEIEYKKK